MIHRALLLLSLLVPASLMYAQRPNPNGPETMTRNDPIPERDPMRAAGRVTGTILTFDDHPVADARVEVRNIDNGQIAGSVYSNAGGHFELRNVPSGHYEVVVRSGLTESRERIVVQGMEVSLNLRLSGPAVSQAGDAATVSVAQMNVPDKARKAYSKAQDAFAKRKLDEANEQISKALSIYPEYAEALTLRSVMELQANQSDAAIADLEKAVQSDHSYAMAHIVLGSAYNAQKRTDDALRVLERAVTLAPRAWQAYFERSRALIAKQQYADALRDLEKAQQFAGQDFSVMHLVKANALLGLRNYPDAQTEIQAYLDREPRGNNAEEARRTLDQLKTLSATAQKQEK